MVITCLNLDLIFILSENIFNFVLENKQENVIVEKIYIVSHRTPIKMC